MSLLRIFRACTARKAVGVVEAYAASVNARDPEAMAATLACPHVTSGVGEVQIWESESEFTGFSDFDSFERGGWDRPDAGKIEATRVAATLDAV